MIGIFHLSFGQGGATRGAPMDGFAAAADQAPEQKIIEFPGDGRLVGIVGGEIGILPVAKHPQALKFFALDRNPFVGVTTTGCTKSELTNRGLFLPQLLIDVQFNRQAMTIPAGDVRTVEAGHSF